MSISKESAVKSQVKKKKDERYRNFATMVYPESAPSDWFQILSDQMIPAFVSPLHENDINPTGEAKKPHYHVIIMFEGKKSKEQIMDIFDLIGGVGLEIVKSIRGYARYLCHLDNPEKAQYDPDSVRSLCGADYLGIIGLPIDRYKAIGEMMDFISQEEIKSYAELLQIARLYHPDWFRILCDNGTYVIKEFIKSYSWGIRSDCFNNSKDS